MAKELPKVYSIEEVVEILQVTRRTVYNYLRAGKLKASKRGKYWRVSEKQLEEFLSATNDAEEGNK